MKNTVHAIINQTIRESIDQYYSKRDADSFFRLVDLLEDCKSNNLTKEDIPTLIELQNVIVMG